MRNPVTYPTLFMAAILVVLACHIGLPSTMSAFAPQAGVSHDKGYMANSDPAANLFTDIGFNALVYSEPYPGGLPQPVERSDDPLTGVVSVTTWFFVAPGVQQTNPKELPLYSVSECAPPGEDRSTVCVWAVERCVWITGGNSTNCDIGRVENLVAGYF